MPRLFFAIPIAPSLHKPIAEIVLQLTKQLGFPAIRWSPPENWHITVRFLGPVPEEKTAACMIQAEKALHCLTPFEFTLDRLAVLHSAHSTSLVIKIPLSTALNELQQTMEKAMVEIGFKAESRVYFPHITLGKLQQPINSIDHLEKIEMPVAMMQIVEEIALLSSDTQPNGSIYSLLKTYKLGGI